MATLVRTPEMQLQHDFEALLQALAVRYARNNSGSKGHVKFGLRPRGIVPEIESGGPDFIVYHAGKDIGVELKTPGEEPNPEQIRWNRHFAVAGYKVYVVDSIEAAKEALKGGLDVAISGIHHYMIASRWKLKQEWGAYVRTE